MNKINTAFALLDADFLRQLDQDRNKELYAKLVSLNWQEEPIAEIQGNVQSGSINIDGSSKVRRTCNLTLVTNSVQIDEVAWSLRTKFYVYLGVKNNINSNYEDIIWFPQGMYVISSFSSSYGAQGYTIQISGKDKMCLINGDVGGALFAAHEFSIIYTNHADGTVTKDYIPIYEIIKEALHVYAHEPYKNIIINDLNACGVELLDYIGTDINLYIYNECFGEDGVETTNIRFGVRNDLLAQCFDDWIDQHDGLSYDLPPFSSSQYPQLSTGVTYTLLKRVCPTDHSTTAGYRATDITYTGELTVAVGGTIAEMLDKIVKMLGEFEYYYDINGRFIFQRKRIYFNSSWSNAVVDEDQTWYESAAIASESVYDFSSSYLIESFQNKPQLNKIHNDYSVWGKITSVNKTKLPIHLRYAIDRKPQMYYSLLDKQLYMSSEVRMTLPDGQTVNGGSYDWRELIYQMARDNLAAQSRIYGLQSALITVNNLHQAELNYAANPSATNATLLEDWQNHVMYHYDIQQTQRANYADYYRYDLTKKKFVQLTSMSEYDSCKAAGEFLYGPNASKKQLTYSSKEWEAINKELGYNYLLASDIDDAAAQLQKQADACGWIAKLLEDRLFTMKTPHYDDAYRPKELNTTEVIAVVDLYKAIPDTYRKLMNLSISEIVELLNNVLITDGGEESKFLTFETTSPVDENSIQVIVRVSALQSRVYRDHMLNFYIDDESELNSLTEYNEQGQYSDIQVQKWLVAIMYGHRDDYYRQLNELTKRDRQKEVAILQRYRDKGMVQEAQAELDAWQDTFATGYEAYYADMLAFWPQLYRTKPAVKILYNDDGTISTDDNGNIVEVLDTLTMEDFDAWAQNGYWNPDYVSYDTEHGTIRFVEPEALFFWLDFCDQDGTNPELYQYAVDVIGRRAKAVNDDNVKCIYLRETPGILFTSPEWTEVAGQQYLAYTRVNVAPPVSDYFRISSQGKSAKEELDSLLYEGTYFNESITFSSIPIYYLEPNNRITVRDDQSGINGDYIIKSLSLQLQHDGMMSVTATRAVARII